MCVLVAHQFLNNITHLIKGCTCSCVCVMWCDVYCIVSYCVYIRRNDYELNFKATYIFICLIYIVYLLLHVTTAFTLMIVVLEQFNNNTHLLSIDIESESGRVREREGENKSNFVPCVIRRERYGEISIFWSKYTHAHTHIFVDSFARSFAL